MVPSENSDEHAAPLMQDEKAIMPASASAPVVGHSAPACLACSTRGVCPSFGEALESWKLKTLVGSPLDATGDPDEIPSISVDEHEAPPWQDKHAATLDLAHEGGGCAPHRLASLGKPTSGEDDFVQRPKVDNVPLSSPAPDKSWFTEEADYNEKHFLEDFQNGRISEEDLREVLDYYREGRIELGTRPSKIREIHIVEARLEIAKSLRLLQGAVAARLLADLPRR